MLPENVRSQKEYKMWINGCVEKRLSRRFEDYMQTRIRDLIEHEVCRKVNLHIPPRLMIDLLKVIQIMEQLPLSRYLQQHEDEIETDYALRGFTRVSKSTETGRKRDRKLIFKDGTYKK